MIAGDSSPIVLVAHGSRDPRAAGATEALVRAVARVRPGRPVRAAYLDHAGPRPGQVLQALQTAGHDRVTVVPLLLTAAYHGRVDLPGAIATARSAGLRARVELAEVLGPVDGAVDDLLIAALRRRLAESGVGPGGVDGLVLAAAGTRDADARRTVDQAADALGAAVGVPCLPAYASAAPPTADVAVRRLRTAGATRIGVAAYFLAPGRLYEAAVASARDAGAVRVGVPLGAADELARLVLARADAALSPVPG